VVFVINPKQRGVSKGIELSTSVENALIVIMKSVTACGIKEQNSVKMARSSNGRISVFQAEDESSTLSRATSPLPWQNGYALVL
jgi:hypothetical protein